MTTPTAPRGAPWYFGSVAAFMIPSGIQTVLLPYLLAIELRQPADRFGVTLMFGQLPVLLLLLVGGWAADRIDPRRLLMGLQGAGMLMPLVLAAVLWLGHVSEPIGDSELAAFVFGTALLSPNLESGEPLKLTCDDGSTAISTPAPAKAATPASVPKTQAAPAK